MTALWLLIAFFSIFASASIGSTKGRTLEGLVAGLMLGPFGIVYAGFLPNGNEKCAHCHGWCFRQATVCQNCGREYPSAQSPFPDVDPMKVSR